MDFRAEPSDFERIRVSVFEVRRDVEIEQLLRIGIGIYADGRHFFKIHAVRRTGQIHAAECFVI